MKNGLVSVALQETSEVQTDNIITEINNKETKNLKNKKLNKVNKVKQQLNNPKLKLNKLKLKPKLRNKFLTKLLRSKAKSFPKQTIIIIKNPNIKNQSITIMKRKLKDMWKKINHIIQLRKSNLIMLLKKNNTIMFQRHKKSLKNNKFIIQLKRKNIITLLKSHKFTVKKNQLKKKKLQRKLKRRLNIMKKKSKKMMNGLLFLLQARIQREDDSYRTFFYEPHRLI